MPGNTKVIWKSQGILFCLTCGNPIKELVRICFVAKRASTFSCSIRSDRPMGRKSLVASSGSLSAHTVFASLCID